MRLAKLRIYGYRKLVDTGCPISGKLVAIVGPNEAGKTSLLTALTRLNDTDPIAHGDRPRGLSVTEYRKAVEATYRLEDNDLEALSDLNTPTIPLWYIEHKTYQGTRYHRLEPPLDRDPTDRIRAYKTLNRFAKTKAAKELTRNATATGYGDYLDVTLSALEEDDGLEEHQREQSKELAEYLAGADSGALAKRSSEHLRSWHQSLETPHPNAVALTRIERRRLRFVLFDEDDRALNSEYDLASAAPNPPPALRNLASLCGLDLESLAQAVNRTDSGAVVTAIEEANEKLASIFQEAWKQSPVVVRLHQDGDTLRILVSNVAGGYSTIAERSDGLKTFVALTAFSSAKREDDHPLALLVDEAEAHLHYDAQADLIRMLERQQLVGQVIYTTHSAGCLPSDLGTGIRPVMPSGGNPSRSEISSSFWTEGPGFTPLLLAMGAGVTAFAPSRYAVLTEGATDMLLLPTLLREATARASLDYQVAPGVAESSTAVLAGLDLEAPRVAYLLDGDSGGAAHARRLTEAGVPRGSVFHLGGPGSGATVERLLREDVYLAAANEALVRRHGAVGALKLRDLQAGARHKAVDKWCDSRNLARIGKAAVASVLLEQSMATKLTSDGKRILKRAHVGLCTALGLPT